MLFHRSLCHSVTALISLLLGGCDFAPFSSPATDHRNLSIGALTQTTPPITTKTQPIGTEITFIHTGDFHGNLHAHPNLRADGNGLLEGGLDRVYTVTSQIKAQNSTNYFHVHTGDTIAGGPEATFTRGNIMVDVVNEFGIDVFTPGNWEFAYGIERFLEFFGSENPLAPWNTIAANAYYTGEAPFETQTPGSHLLPPYRIELINGLRVGMFGCTTNRGPTIVSDNITQGIAFSDCRGTTLNAGTPNEQIIPPEIPFYVDKLRNEEKVDLVILLSEAGIAENIYNAQTYDGIDIIFSSDMHEETKVPVIIKTPSGGQTLLIEEGEDGAQVGELHVWVDQGAITNWEWTAHDIDERIAANEHLEDLIETLSEPFTSEAFEPGQFVNPYNGAKLMMPLDTVVGYTEIPLDRNAFSNEANPALIEGRGHDFITDAFRVMTGAQIGAIRGFRYTNTIAPGPITYGDLYHYIPIGPQVAVGEIRGAQLNGQIENSANSSMDPVITNWRGGWLFNFSGLTFDIDPFLTKEMSPISAGRAFNLMLDENADGTGDVAITDADTESYYRYASYFYANSPTSINRIPIDEAKQAGIQVLAKGNNGDLILLPPNQITADNVVDATDVIVKYLQTLPHRTVTANHLPFPRIQVVNGPLPDTTEILGFPVIEPVFGMDRRRYIINTDTNNIISPPSTPIDSEDNLIDAVENDGETDD